MNKYWIYGLIYGKTTEEGLNRLHEHYKIYEVNYTIYMLIKIINKLIAMILFIPICCIFLLFILAQISCGIFELICNIYCRIFIDNKIKIIDSL